jgi:AcrR family transcriptional regulator
MPSYRDRQKSTIVKIARDILATEGLEGLQARRVAGAADCSVGTIYNLFGSLDMVIIAANAETLGELHQLLLQAKESEPKLGGQLDALAKAYLEFALARTLEWRALFEHRFATKTSVPEWYRLSQAELFAVVEELLQPAIQAEAARIEAARALFSAVHGVVSIALDQKLGEFDRPATERQVQFIVKSIAQGINDNHQH